MKHYHSGQLCQKSPLRGKTSELESQRHSKRDLGSKLPGFIHLYNRIKYGLTGINTRFQL